jgi:tetratricopeptide (TPR) repeat protein
MRFLDASMAQQQEEERQAGAIRQRELRQARRQVTVLLFGLIVAIGLALWAIAAQRRAESSNNEFVEIFRQTLFVMDNILSQLNEKTVKDVPSFQPIRVTLAESVLQYYEKLVNQYTDNPSVRAWAWNSLGWAQHSQGKLALAVVTYKKQLEFTPDHKDAWNNLGNTLTALGRLEEAAQAYEKQLQVAPQMPEPSLGSRPPPLSTRPSSVNEKQDKPRSISVLIATQPSGFDIYRGDQRVGTTPGRFDEPIGSHFKAVLKREGFKDTEINFRVNEHGNDYLFTPEKSSRR